MDIEEFFLLRGKGFIHVYEYECVFVYKYKIVPYSYEQLILE